MNRKQLLAALAAAVTLAAGPAAVRAQETPWSVRVGGTFLDMANKSGAFPALGADFPSDAVHVNNKWIPELDVYYAFTPNWVAQLVLTYPQEQEVTLGGPANNLDLGSFKHLPPSLVAQYHFLPGQQFDPYVGVGVNFTWITSVNLSVAGVPLDLKRTSWGSVLNIGGDYNLDKHWFLNADVKYIYPLQSDVTVNGNELTNVKLNPYLFSVGVGYHF